MLFPRLRRSQVIGSVLVLGCALFGCAAPDRVDPTWKEMRLTPESMGMIDTSVVAVQATDAKRATVQQLVAAGFEVQTGAVLEVRRTGDDQAGFARDLARLSELIPGAVHLVVHREGQRCEIGDAFLVTPRHPEQLSALLARHHLQLPQNVINTTVRAVTQPRDDLLHLNERIAALRADPDVDHAEFDLITHATRK